jgi:hypothetical protein
MRAQPSAQAAAPSGDVLSLSFSVLRKTLPPLPAYLINPVGSHHDPVRDEISIAKKPDEKISEDGDAIRFIALNNHARKRTHARKKIRVAHRKACNPGKKPQPKL